MTQIKSAGDMTVDREPESVPSKTTDRFALLGLSVEELGERLAPWIDKPFRVRQIHHALHVEHVRSLSEITTLSKTLRRTLSEQCTVGWPSTREAHRSADGTVKYLFELADGATIETVDIPDGRRRTICVSSQAGCALACQFCVTGYWGAGRSLTAGEIVAQVFEACRDHPPEQTVNVVFMGMGEPLLNVDAVRTAFEILTERISWRRITLSTAGVVPGIDAMADWPKLPNLAISLHAADDELREKIMPINRTYPLAELMASLRRYPLKKGRRITFEYVMIRDLNDSPAHADRLVGLVRGLPSKVNLIPVNADPVLGPKMVPSTDEATEAFRVRLLSHGLLTTVRKRRGDDVSAACGQLRAPDRSPRGFRRSNLSL